MDYNRVIRIVPEDSQEAQDEFERIRGLIIALGLGIALGISLALVTVTSWAWLN